MGGSVQDLCSAASMGGAACGGPAREGSPRALRLPEPMEGTVRVFLSSGDTCKALP